MIRYRIRLRLSLRMKKNNLDLCIDKKQVCSWEMKTELEFLRLWILLAVLTTFEQSDYLFPPSVSLRSDFFLDTAQENKCWKRKKKECKEILLSLDFEQMSLALRNIFPPGKLISYCLFWKFIVKVSHLLTPEGDFVLKKRLRL